jgi:hypothetical protein
MVISSRLISKFHLEPAKMLFSRRHQSLEERHDIYEANWYKKDIRHIMKHSQVFHKNNLKTRLRSLNQGIPPPSGGGKHSPAVGCDWEVFVIG